MPPTDNATKPTTLAAGLAAAAAVSLVAEVAARLFVDAHGDPRVPAVILALLLGAVAANAAGAGRKVLGPGLDFVKKRVLRAAIVLYGLGLTAKNLKAAGLPVLTLIAVCLLVSLGIAALLGAAFGASPKAKLLLGCGTAICGATAVVTIAPLIEADDDEVGFAVATIFLFNLVALIAFPAIGHALHLSDVAFGAWAGTAVNDTSAVVATGRAFSGDAATFATLVKVIRTLALVPMAIVVGASAGRLTGRAEGTRVPLAKIFPWFVLGFALTAALAVFVPLPAVVTLWAKKVAGILVTSVLAAVGLHLDARKIVGSGARSLALGFAIAAAMAFVSFGLIRLLAIG